MGMSGQRHLPDALPPGKTRYPLYRRLGVPQGRSGRVRKISPPPGFDPRTVQSVASRYTECAIVYGYIYIYIYSVGGKTTWLRDGPSGFRIPKAARNFTLLQSVYIGSGVHQASSPGFPPGVKRSDRSANSTLTSI